MLARQLLPPVLAGLAIACASTPISPAAAEEEEINVTVAIWSSALEPMITPGLLWPERLEGVACTLRNDRGTWSATAPGRVKVLRSSDPLVVDCTADGYKPYHETRRCIPKAELERQAHGHEVPLLLMLVPFTIVAAPIAPQLAAQAGAQAAMGAVSLATSHGAVEQNPGLCTYGTVTAAMAPR